MGKVRIAHASDLHEDWRKLYKINRLKERPDVIVLSGDMMPDKNRFWMIGHVDHNEQRVFQERWLRERLERWTAIFDGRPVMVVGGNHDFANLASLLREEGCPNVHHLHAGGPIVEVCGLRFAGFRSLPWINGMFMGEVTSFGLEFQYILDAKPDVLVTHSPPHGILDEVWHENIGIPGLVDQMVYGDVDVKAHLFGHVHNRGGNVVTEHGIQFSNAATTVNLIEIETANEKGNPRESAPTDEG